MLRQEFGSRGVYTASRLLPPKRTFGNLDASFVAERRVALERYLCACIESETICNSAAFCHFVDGAKRAESYLLEQSSRRVSWKSRFFCLYDTELLFYYSEAVSNPFQPLNLVHVTGASVRRASLPSLSRYFLFTVRTSQHEWWMAADTESARDAWLLALCNAGTCVCVVMCARGGGRVAS
ncbi:hypothetical protein T492DRAFT_140550 [Pavlovales sp. CCMP2436]|nr:hypothetical protein T492DRAFT_140550 [Pavlovales sp. CCMP2436]